MSVPPSLSPLLSPLLSPHLCRQRAPTSPSDSGDEDQEEGEGEGEQDLLEADDDGDGLAHMKPSSARCTPSPSALSLSDCLSLSACLSQGNHRGPLQQKNPSVALSFLSSLSSPLHLPVLSLSSA
jgi:hypothetical protein